MSSLFRTLACSLSFLLLAAAVDAAELVVIVRHAERQTGEGDDSLSAAGRARAERLLFVLKDAGITDILTSDLKRTQETAAPVAKARSLPPRVIPIEEAMGGTPPAERQVARTAEAVKGLPATARVLIVGHSNTVPLLLKALGAEQTITIPADEFDNLFLLAPTSNGAPVVTRLRY